MSIQMTCCHHPQNRMLEGQTPWVECKWWSRDYGDAAERRSSFALRASSFALRATEDKTEDKTEDRHDRGDQELCKT